jgi:hypothetical protein
VVGVVEFTVNDDAVEVFAGKEGAAMGKECVVEVGEVGEEGAAMGKECVVEVGFAMWIGVGVAMWIGVGVAMWIGVGVGSKWEAVADGDELGIGSRGCGRISDGDSGSDSGTSTWGWGWGA